MKIFQIKVKYLCILEFFSNFAADIQKLSVLSDEEYTGTKTDIPQTTKYPVVSRVPPWGLLLKEVQADVHFFTKV